MAIFGFKRHNPTTSFTVEQVNNIRYYYFISNVNSLQKQANKNKTCIVVPSKRAACANEILLLPEIERYSTFELLAFDYHYGTFTLKTIIDNYEIKLKYDAKEVCQELCKNSYIDNQERKTKLDLTFRWKPLKQGQQVYIDKIL